MCRPRVHARAFAPVGASSAGRVRGSYSLFVRGSAHPPRFVTSSMKLTS